MITHNKRTVAGADVLYGVTMEESGISKLVAIRLENRARGEPVASPRRETAVVRLSGRGQMRRWLLALLPAAFSDRDLRERDSRGRQAPLTVDLYDIRARPARRGPGRGPPMSP
ncbi:MAG: hypothetical protein MZU91_14430 [Desulfosudis oleivorans]|nr:hypothetical protein [Desulfosudis oleivorans]